MVMQSPSAVILCKQTSGIGASVRGLFSIHIVSSQPKAYRVVAFGLNVGSTSNLKPASGFFKARNEMEVNATFSPIVTLLALADQRNTFASNASGSLIKEHACGTKTLIDKAA